MTLYLDALALRLSLHVLALEAVIGSLALSHQVVVEATRQRHRLFVLTLQRLNYRDVGHYRSLEEALDSP